MQKQQKSKKKTKKQVTYNGRLYTATAHRGDAVVRTQCGSQGQNSVIGVLSLVTGQWRSESSKNPVPYYVKQQLELAFL